ncbi:MAG: tetratricopeptide repeat protein, partial [Candidatus Marinimicrobia bacterium]|nr:tetratricopeptide repeat protein [Candidatus Neomarinimicrobiota bacterium]
MRKSPGHISTLLQRMVQSGYLLIATNPNDKRSKLYRIKEGFFDLWLAMNQSRLHRKRFPFLVEFFERWYSDKKEREKKRCELRVTTKENTDERSNQITDEITGYLSDIGSKDEQVQTKIEIALEKLKDGDIEYSAEMLTELKPLAGDSKLFTWMTDKLGLWQSGGIEKDIYRQFEEMIDYWRKYRSGDLEDAAQIAQQLSYDFTRSGLHQINELFLKDALEKTGSESQKISLLLQLANSQRIDGRYNTSLQTLDITLILCQDFNDRKNESVTLNNISQVYHARGDYDKALKYMEDSLKICQEIGDKTGEGATLNNISTVYQARG